MSTTLTEPERARALFASPLQESGRPTPQQIRAVVEAAPVAADCLGCVAQEAGDHPEVYLLRMRWALHAVAQAYATETAGG
ncbi:hypothetical protein [Actinomadura rugatobispora]|uniref:Uncharacterized protein n=1 Tax=Actinomadura rugatobispora TaxID=1994 RepID=A0ABW1A636_9ACTN|nr:hypothetical protein GCM10010200_012750 [Actinomadura rugatobispora]